MPEITFDARPMFAAAERPTADELYRRADELSEREEKAREKAEAKAERRALVIRTLTNVAEGNTPRHGDPMAAVEAARTLLEIS